VSCNRLGALALLILALFWPMAATAQIAGTVEPKAGESIAIELDEGQLVRLNEPAASVFITNPSVADINVRSTQLVYLYGRTPGKTTLFALDSNDNVIANMEIVVQHNMTRLQGALEALLPTAGVNVTSIDGGIILSGTVATGTDAENARRITARFIAEGEDVINRLMVTEPNQVNLRVQIAEVRRNILNKFGINMNELLLTAGNLSIGIVPNFTQATAEATTITASGASIGGLDIGGVLDALADDGLVTILSEPNLTALSGETASFLSGGQFPIIVSGVTSSGSTSIETQFYPYGVSLEFTPTVIGEHRINLRVRPSVTSIDASRTRDGIPGTFNQEADTTVELASGQSFAIAGLLSETSAENLYKTPGIGDIPILGALFRSEQFQRDETELVIVVTPYLVRPVSNERIPLPTDPFMRQVPGVSGTAKGNGAIAQTVPVSPAGAPGSGQTGSAQYILD
jgi:pilus assembly protein CpaC